jgi:hypothetical protein
MGVVSIEANVRYCCSEFRSDRRNNAIFIITEDNEEKYAFGCNNTIKYCPHCGEVLPEEPF